MATAGGGGGGGGASAVPFVKKQCDCSVCLQSTLLEIMSKRKEHRGPFEMLKI